MDPAAVDPGDHSLLEGNELNKGVFGIRDANKEPFVDGIGWETGFGLQGEPRG